ncbi:MAG: hypothetical protein JO244_05865 [Solirubrobacterales bacterium]|nr:hypothetical protein [Solirubrobacterales bacterium]
MTTTDYILNALFVFLVVRQARERKLDLRSVLVPLAIVGYVAHIYIHSLPTAGNDLVLVGALLSVGLILGILGGFATHIRVADGSVFTRVGWLAGALLIAGLTARMGFVLAVQNGLEPAIRSFSITHQIGAAAWPVALVAMALTEVVVRQLTVAVRAHRLISQETHPALAAGAHA